MSKRKRSILDFLAKVSTKKLHADTASCSSQCEPVLQQNDAVSRAEITPASKSAVVQLVTDVAKDTAADVSERIHLPECWDQNQWLDFKQKYPWLFVENGLLGCNVCREVKHLGASDSQGVSVTQGVSVSKEWSTGRITPYGKTKKDMLTSLRKKIHVHKISEAHVKAGHIQAVSELLQSNIAEQQKHKFASTTKLFRTAYFCVKKNLPLTDFRDLIGLQVANGADLGCIRHSEHTAAKIIDYIASEMRKKLCNAIVQQAPKLSVYIDESAIVSSHSVLIVYIRASVNGKCPVTFFLDMLDLPNADAQSVEAALLACLSKHGFSNDFLAKNWIGVCSDGASVLLGRQSGFLEGLSERYPQLVKWHCLCHRLEPCASDTIDSFPVLHHVTSFFEKLYAVYHHQSLKHLSGLFECAKELEVQVLKIGKEYSVSRVASSHKAIQAVWESYPALHSHFLKASLSSTLNTHQKSMFSGLYKVLISENYLLNLAGIADAVQEIRFLSQALQRDDITLPHAYQLINRSVRAIEKMKDTPGKHLKEVMESLDKGYFKGVAIIPESSKGQVMINLTLFYQCLVDNLRSRLNALTVSSRPAASPQSDEFETLVSEVDILNCQRWPINVDSPWFEGEAKLEQLCKRLRLSYASIREGFRDYIDHGGAEVPENLKPVVTAVNSLPVTSGYCGRAFRTINVLMSPIGSRLDTELLSSPLFISLTGPPADVWDPLPYVAKWLTSNCCADDAKSPKVEKHELHGQCHTSLWEIF